MKKYNYLIGKTKKDVMDELGDECNYMPDNVWTYTVGKNWFKMNKVLHLYFTDDTVKNIKISCK